MKRATSIPVAKVEVAKVPILLNRVVQALVENLDQRPHVCKVLVHLRTIGEIAENVTKFEYTCFDLVRLKR